MYFFYIIITLYRDAAISSIASPLQNLDLISESNTPMQDIILESDDLPESAHSNISKLSLQSRQSLKLKKIITYKDDAFVYKHDENLPVEVYMETLESLKKSKF